VQESSIPSDGSSLEKPPELRVLLVAGSFPPMRCGVGDYSYGLAKALAVDQALHIAVLTSVSGGGAAKTDGIEVYPLMKHWSIAETPQVVTCIRQWSPDIVHIQYPTQGYGNGFLPWILPIIAFMMRKKVVQTWHEGYGKRSAPKLFLKAIIPGGLVLVRPQYKDGLPISLRWALWNKQIAFIRNASPMPKADMDERARNDLRTQYLKGQKRLIVFFGFVYPNKGAELLFEIADPTSDHIVIAGEFVEGSDYHRNIMRLASAQPWEGKATITGFLLSGDIAALLAIADAVILPYRVGGGDWNTSIHAAVLQGSFVITTSLTRHGYDEKHNVFYARVDDEQEMISALATYAGRKREYHSDIDRDEWKIIANRHRLFYETLLSE